jgi:hypothetical protein
MKKLLFTMTVCSSLFFSMVLLSGTSYSYLGEFYGEWKLVDKPVAENTADTLLIAERQFAWPGREPVSYRELSEDRDGWEIDVPFFIFGVNGQDVGNECVLVFSRGDRGLLYVGIFDKTGDGKRGRLIAEEQFRRVEIDNERNFTGKIGSYDISMQLYVSSTGKIVGYYYYNKYATKIYLSGELRDNNISLALYDKNHKAIEGFSGIYSDNEIHGEWKKDKRKFTFDLIQNPWDDHLVSCEEMHKYPNEVFDEKYLDLGSGHGSPNEVDYYCEGGLGNLPFLNKLIRLAEGIRSEGPQHICTGSIVHLHWRAFHFELLKGGLAPDINARHDEEWEKSADSWQPYNLYENELKYFKLWAHQSLYNFELYNNFWREYAQVKPELTDYYCNKFKYFSDNADYYADHALRIIVRYAAGSFPYDLQGGTPDISEIEKFIMNPKITENDLAVFLSKGVSQQDLDQALKVALLYAKPQNFLNILFANGARIDSGDESALFFSLRNIDSVRFLLEHGADVNYENGFGKTALFYAIGFKDHELAELLIQNKADVNHAYASKEELSEKIWSNNPFYQSYCLLEHAKRTPLMHAAQNSDVSMIRLLLENGARLEALDEMGYNALDYAFMGKKNENIAYLESLGLKKAQKK